MADDIIARLRCSYADPPCEQCTFCAARAEIERLRAVVDAIDVLHQPDAKTGLCSECAQSDGFTTAGYTEGPCDTYLLLHPKEARRG